MELVWVFTGTRWAICRRERDRDREKETEGQMKGTSWVHGRRLMYTLEERKKKEMRRRVDGRTSINIESQYGK